MVHACTRKFLEAFVPKSKKVKVDINPIPTREDIKLISYEQDGEAKYDISYTDAYGCGERYMLINDIDESIFLEYQLDGNYEVHSLNEVMGLSEVLEYDIAREKKMDILCLSMLNTLCERLTTEASLNKGRVYTMKTNK